jgi:DNA-binding SARP family transcriptional activator
VYKCQNASEKQLMLEQDVLHYRHEYQFGRIKGDRLAIAPMFVRRDDQVVGLPRLLSLGARLLTLIMIALEEHMSLSDLPKQDVLAKKSEISSAAFLLKRGLSYLVQGRYAEGVAIFTLIHEQLPSDQMHLAAVLDTFIRDYMSYQQAQQAFHQASRCFIEAEAERQARVTAFEKLLPALIDNLESPMLTEVQPANNTNCSLSLQLPSEDGKIHQTSHLSKPLPDENTSLPALYFTCFGHFEARRSGQPIALCSNRCGQSILRFLVARQQHCATSDTLLTLLWPDEQPEAALNKLHIAISALRRSLNHGYSCEPGGGYIVCKNRTYSLNPAIAVRTDVEEFLQYYQAGQQASEERIALYEKACNLYTGPFLSEDIYVDWSSPRREELSKIYISMCNTLAKYCMQQKQYEDATKWTAAILRENRCDEAAHQQLMQIYAVQGRRCEALQQYHRCKLVLHEELGVQPLPETLLLFQALLADEPSSIPIIQRKHSTVTEKTQPSMIQLS